jgi:hypothetical protein
MPPRLGKRLGQDLSPDGSPNASPRLLQAAAAGLLALGLVACSDDEKEPTPASAHITSTKTVEGLDEAGFKELCDARDGTVEVMPHCGGFATAPGFSYDVTTQLLAEHTCQGANTCTGWNCVTDS